MKNHKSFIVLFLATVPLGYLAQGQPADSAFPKPFTQMVEGWVVEFGAELKEKTNAQIFNQSVKARANHLQRIAYLIPKSKLEENPMEFFAEMTEAYVGMNDFYPFVRAELKTYDPQTFALLRKIWGDFEFSHQQ